MIDAERAVFQRVREEALRLFPGLTVLNARPDVPESIPALILEEENNASYARALAGDGKERFARVTYLMTVIADEASGGKTAAKRIAGAADGIMCGAGFARLSFSPSKDRRRGVAGFTGRYGAVIAAPEEERQDGEEPRLVYRIYRK